MENNRQQGAILVIMKKDGQSPLKRGKLQDAVKPVHRHVRPKEHDLTGKLKSQKELMKIDLIRALAEIGIEIKNVATLANLLVEEGWTKIKHIKRT